MSFMFKPLAYDDMSAINKIDLSRAVTDSIIGGKDRVANDIVKRINDTFAKTGRCVLLIDGYVSARFLDLVSRVNTKLTSARLISMTDLYKSEDEINRLTEKNVPENLDDDPVLLFGYLEPHTMEEFLDPQKFDALLEELKNPGIYIVYGIGACVGKLRNLSDIIAYIDVTPKVAAIRARSGEVTNIGDKKPRKFNLVMRRNYYVDFNLVFDIRKELLDADCIDYYITGSNDDYYFAMPSSVLNDVMSTLVRYPFRAKPVYLEGIWGGEFIRKVRKLPMDIASNVAWIFDFIPLEVSIAVDCAGKYIEFPFFTFVQKKGLEMMGRECVEEFGGFFPVRFNYDDSWHSDGNMSIQVHPDEDFVIENYNEFGRQDEAYYVIATGHDAKTYCGFREGEDIDEFFRETTASEKDGRTVDYRKYVNYVDSVPGLQVMLPAGTIHSSGQNQFILELGSLTVGSYTYKIYDYNRREKDGSLRPIHSKNAMKTVKHERTTSWVHNNLIIEPILIDEKDDYREYVVGRTELMYYETHRIDVKTHGIYEGNNNGKFTVLTLVDGEHCTVRSKLDPLLKYDMSFLEIVTVPAGIDEYIIENTGYQPIVVHKVVLRDNYARYKDKKHENR